MRRESVPIVIALAFTSTALADDKPVTPTAHSPEARYQALISEYQAAKREHDRAFTTVTTKAEKLALAEADPGLRFADLFLNLAIENSQDPSAFDALSWVVLRGRNFPEGARAIAILSDKHARNPKVADVFPNLEFNPLPEAERLLRSVLDGDADHRTRGLACFTLARRRLRSSEFAREAAVRLPANMALLGRTYTVESMRSLAQGDPEALRKDSLAYFDRTIRDFGDIPSSQSSLGEMAKRESFKARFLNVGQVAPEIEGIDGDGVAFKLSDYRGKVVLLNFWGDWCPPCRAAYPHERALAKALENKPFAWLGVNSDTDKAKIKMRMTQERLPIRYWVDGSTEGPIDTTWNITGWPFITSSTRVVSYASGLWAIKKRRSSKLSNAASRNSGTMSSLAASPHLSEAHPLEIVPSPTSQH